MREREEGRANTLRKGNIGKWMKLNNSSKDAFGLRRISQG